VDVSRAGLGVYQRRVAQRVRLRRAFIDAPAWRSRDARDGRLRSCRLLVGAAWQEEEGDDGAGGEDQTADEAGVRDRVREGVVDAGGE
jgi:hypothetical protein